jgi:hypothetical protein
MSTVYALPTDNYFLAHGHQLPQALRDGSFDIKPADVSVASGDYFAELATKLDTIALEIAATDGANSHILHDLVTELLYLQSTYKITRQ